MSALTHGWKGLLFAYALVFVPMVVAMVRHRASWWRVLLSPWHALLVMVMVGVVVAVVGALLNYLGMAKGGPLESIVIASTFAALGYVSGLALAGERPSDRSHRRGAVVWRAVPISRWRRWWHSTRGGQRGPDLNRPITLAGIPVAPQDETKHFKFIGTTGTGKSTAICEMLSAALARGDRAVIADPDGGYLSHFYDVGRGDVILNPFDPDSMKWDLLGEITNDYDVDQLARSLIPDGYPDRTWSEYARTFFIAVIQQAIAAGVKDDREVCRLLTATAYELKLLLTGTMAGPFLDEASEKMFGSLRSVAVSAVSALKYTVRQQASPFSVRQWVRQGAARGDGGGGGALFLPYKAGEIAALRSIISAWLRIAIFEAMNRPEGDQRLWFVVDELDALGEIDGLKDALARLRKFGGRCVLGFQSISQVSSTYGRGAADTIVENCGNTLILRCSASEQGGTSQFASRLIGQREVVYTSESRTQRSDEWVASSTTTSEHRSIEPAVMASEIERLPDLVGFLKFASIPDWLHVRLAHVSYPTVDRSTQRDSPASTPEAEASAPVAGVSDTAKNEQGDTRAEIGVAAKKSRRKGKLGD